MNETEYEEQRQRVQAVADRWLEMLGLRWWDMSFDWLRDGIPSTGKISDAWQTLMDCEVDWRYLRANIRFNLPALSLVDDDVLENAVVHELVHVFVNELRGTHIDDEEYGDHEERVVSTLAKAFVWVRDATRQERRSAA